MHHRSSILFLIYFVLFTFCQGKLLEFFTLFQYAYILQLDIFPGCHAQLCLEDGAVNEKLRDQKFIERQLDCILAEHDQHCDQFGAQLKRMAPDIFRGNCVKPCTKCTKKQIQKVIVVLQRKYPREFSLIVRRYSQNRG